MEETVIARAFVALGSNLHAPQRQVRIALQAIKRLPGTRLRASSGLYRTPPWGDTRQPHFINAVAELETSLGPHRLLAYLLAIEQVMGRVRTLRYGPRIIDLDLLCHGQTMITSPELCLPHPRMQERAFVMIPLAEVAPELSLAGFGLAADLAAALESAAIVRVGESLVAA